MMTRKMTRTQLVLVTVLVLASHVACSGHGSHPAASAAVTPADTGHGADTGHREDKSLSSLPPHEEHF